MAFGFVLLGLLWLWSGSCLAEPWVVVANKDDRTIHTIDLGLNPPVVYGPFLAGQLGGSGELMDVAVTPDGRYALVSNFQENRIYKIDLSDPKNPVLAGSAELSFSAEDIALTPDGRYALVTDGGWFSSWIALVRVSDLSVIREKELTGYAQCVATNGHWVVVCDSNNSQIIYGRFDENEILLAENTLPAGVDPINAVFSPDGRTLLVANGLDTTVSVYRVDETAITRVNDLDVPEAPQSIAFSPDGQRAFVLSTSPSPDTLSWLRVNGPGDVVVGGLGVADLLSDTDGALYGVDVLGVTPDGRYALAGNPASYGTLTRDLALVDLSDFRVSTIPLGSDFPVGLAIFIQETESAPVNVPVFTPLGALGLAGLLALAASRRLKGRP